MAAEFIALAAAFCAAGAGIGASLRLASARKRWQAIADQLGLQFVTNDSGSDYLEGRILDHQVKISCHRDQSTAIEVSGGPSFPEKLQVEPRHLWFAEEKQPAADKIQLSSLGLEHVLRRLGLAHLFLIHFSAEGHLQVYRTIGSAYLSIRESKIRFTCPVSLESASLLQTITCGIVRLAQTIAEPDRLPQRLENVCLEHSVPVKLRYTFLELLLSYFPHHPGLDRTLGQLHQEFASKMDHKLSVLVMRALSHRGHSVPFLDTLEQMRLAPEPQLRVRALKAALSLPKELSRTWFLEALKDPTPEVSSLGARLLPLVTSIGDEDAESALLRCLYHGRPEARVDIVVALAKIGGPRSIAPLIDLQTIGDPGIRRICAHSLDRLRERYPDRESGNLAVVEMGGELSLDPES